MRRFAALVSYDGTDFKGFQRQRAENGPTVQGAIEAALGSITGEALAIEGAGRTDSGVHATGQVISFSSAARFDPETWRQALNAHLPEAIAIRAVREVAADFHARKSALARSYRYRIVCDPVRAPLMERYAWRVGYPLDAQAMDAAAARLHGEHDFGAFGASPRDNRSEGYRGHTVRTMLEARCEAQAGPCGEGAQIVCVFTANAFLTGMVRRLVGALALVGARRLSVDAFVAILEARERGHRGPVAPARGLCLTGVGYPADAVVW